MELGYEPGRLIVGNAGILVTKVLYLNPRPSRTFLVVDAAMNDLVRPAMYDAYHEIWPVTAAASARPRGVATTWSARSASRATPLPSIASCPRRTRATCWRS